MPRIADYTIIKDERFTIQTGGDIDQTFNFSLESGAHLGSRSILAFVLFVSGNAKSLKFEVLVNGSVQLSYTYSGFRSNTLHEVIAADLLKQGTNSIEFRIVGGTGKLEFGDVVLWWQRDV